LISIGKKFKTGEEVQNFREFRANELMKTRIIEHRQSPGQLAGNVALGPFQASPQRASPSPSARRSPRTVRGRAKNFKFRANKLMEAGIIECIQELRRGLSARRASRDGADYNLGPEARST
jgi:hypothetical protein